MGRTSSRAAVVLAAFTTLSLSAGPAQPDDGYLTWTAKQADTIGRSTYETGQVGRTLDLRVLRTERSYNYKLAASWLTPEVIKATIRLQMLTGHLDEQAARAMASHAINAAEMAVLVEIDPREGSGVIPDDWIAHVEPHASKNQPLPAITGIKTPERRTQAAFQGVRRRDYAFDRFWVSFPLVKDGVPTIPSVATELHLLVRIYDKVGRVKWPLTPELREALGLR